MPKVGQHAETFLARFNDKYRAIYTVMRCAYGIYNNISEPQFVGGTKMMDVL